MAAIAGALAAYVMGKSDRRTQRHKRAMSFDESMAHVKLSAKDNKNGSEHSATAADVVPDRAQEDRLPSDNLGCASDILEEILEDQEALREAHEVQYAKLEAKCHRLHKDALRYKDTRDDLREQHDEIKKQYERLEIDQRNLQYHLDYATTRYKYVVENVIQPFARSRDLQWNDQTAETISVVLDPLATDALEARTLRDQVRVLQKEMLAKLDKVQVLPDEQLAQEFRSLTALIKTLSRTIQFLSNSNVVEISEAPAFLRHVDQRHWQGRARKKCLVEAWVWCVLVDFVFQSPFATFGAEGEYLHRVWQGIFGMDHAHMWPVPTALSETWRYTTVEQLAGQADLTSVAAGKSDPDNEYGCLELSILEARRYVHDAIVQDIATITAATELPLINPILDKAFALALRMSSQRFRLQVTYPLVGMAFDRNSMCPLPDPDSEDTEEGTVAFVVNPGLTKWGDANGKNLDQRFDIVSSLVKLDAPEPSHNKRQAHADGLPHNIQSG